MLSLLEGFHPLLAGFLAGLFDQRPPTWLNELAEANGDLRHYAEAVQSAVGVWGRELAD